MQSLCGRLDAFDHWILRLSCLQCVANEQVMITTDTIPPAMQVIRDARLRYFSHVAQSSSAEDHCRAISAALQICPNQEWKCLPGRLTATWLRTVEKDLAPTNFGLHTAWRNTQNHVTWSRIVNTATLHQDECQWWWWWCHEKDMQNPGPTWVKKHSLNLSADVRRVMDCLCAAVCAKYDVGGGGLCGCTS